MSVSEFTGVISSDGLDELAVSEACPRELLGLTCIINEYGCLCEQVASSQFETVKPHAGEAAVVRLTLNLIPNVGQPRAVMTGIDLTGYKADFEVSREAVRASFVLKKPQNADLRAFVRETGI